MSPIIKPLAQRRTIANKITARARRNGRIIALGKRTILLAGQLWRTKDMGLIGGNAANIPDAGAWFCGRTQTWQFSQHCNKIDERWRRGSAMMAPDTQDLALRWSQRIKLIEYCRLLIWSDAGQERGD